MVVLDREEKDLSPPVKDGQISATVAKLNLPKVIQTLMSSVAIVAVWVVSCMFAVPTKVSGPPRFLVGIRFFALARLAMIVVSSGIVRINLVNLQLSKRRP